MMSFLIWSRFPNRITVLPRSLLPGTDGCRHLGSHKNVTESKIAVPKYQEIWVQPSWILQNLVISKMVAPGKKVGTATRDISNDVLVSALWHTVWHYGTHWDMVLEL